MIIPKQGTEEWLDFRKTRITSTDVAIILGHNPYKTIRELYFEKIGEKEPDKMNKAMEHGRDTEPQARERLNELTGITFVPEVVIHPEFPHFMASMDGLDFSKERGCEIKCPYNRISYESACTLRFPKLIDFTQMQWHMFVQKLKGIIYFVYWNKDDFFMTECLRNQEYIDGFMDPVNEFYDCLINKTPPEDKYTYPTTLDAKEACNLILKGKRLEQEGKDLQKEGKAALLEITDYKPAKCFGVRLEVSECKGSIVYKDIPELKDIDLEVYRKEGYVKYSCYTD